MKRAKDDKGQSLVEFALILPILVLFILGIIDFGFIFFNYLTVEEASRDAARYATLPNSTYTGVKDIVGTDLNESQGPVDCGQQPTSSRVEVCVTTNPASTVSPTSNNPHPSDLTGSYSITVEVKGIVPLFDPILGAIVGNNVTLTASTTMQSE